MNSAVLYGQHHSTKELQYQLSTLLFWTPCKQTQNKMSFQKVCIPNERVCNLHTVAKKKADQ